MNPKPTELKGETDKSKPEIGAFNTAFLVIELEDHPQRTF